MKEALQPLRGNVHRDSVGILSGARRVDGGAIQIRSEDLHVVMALERFQAFAQKHGQAEGLLARGTTGDPDPQGGFFRPGLEQLLEPRREGLPGSGIPEEIRHGDEQLLAEEIDLVGMFLEKADVVVGLGGRAPARPLAGLGRRARRLLLGHERRRFLPSLQSWGRRMGSSSVCAAGVEPGTDPIGLDERGSVSYDPQRVNLRTSPASGCGGI